MMKIARALRHVTLAVSILAVFSSRSPAQDTIESAGAAVGVSAGNAVFLPAKAIAVSMGLISGALSFVLTGGNADLTRQIWRDTTEGPYLITQEIAYKSVGRRPELLEDK